MTHPMVQQGIDARERVVEFILAHVREHGYPPAIRDICDALGFASPASVHHHLELLIEEGRIQKVDGKPRAIRVIKDPAA